MALILAANLEFTGFRKQKYMTYDRFCGNWKRSVWQNPDQERTNHNARIYLKSALPYNKNDSLIISYGISPDLFQAIFEYTLPVCGTNN